MNKKYFLFPRNDRIDSRQTSKKYNIEPRKEEEYLGATIFTVILVVASILGYREYKFSKVND